jgi:opacity protein-like surface antigen
MMKTLLSTLLAVLLLCSLSFSQVPKLGVGGYGGMNIPIVQDDQGNGTAFGILARVSVLPFLIAEPNVMFGKWGDPGKIEGVDLGLEGSKIKSYGIDALLGAYPGRLGIKPYFVAGVASYKIENDDTHYEETKLGWSAGLGIGFGVAPSFDLDLRGKLLVAPQEEGSKKALTITGGLVYYLGIGL